MIGFLARQRCVVPSGSAGVPIGRIRYCVIAFTYQRVLICYTGKLGVRKVLAVVGELPRGIRFQVPSGAWSNIDVPTTDGTITLRVGSRFSKDIVEGNASQAAGPQQTLR